MPLFEVSREHFVISTDSARLDLDAIHATLTAAESTRGISRALVERAIAGSLCFGLYDGARQIGFARVITDRATFAHLCDFYIAAEQRRRGLGSWLLEVVRSHPDLRSLQRFLLVAREGHQFYQRHAFLPLATPERFMEVFRADAYTASSFAPSSFLEATLTPPGVAEDDSARALTEPATIRDPRVPDWEEANAGDEFGEAEGNGKLPASVRVRPLAEGEGALLRRLRLGALRESPHTFGERLEDAANRPQEEWVEQARTLASPGGPRLFIAEVDAEAAGLVLAVEDPFDQEICRVGGMWVTPPKRRRGAAYCMLKAAMIWAEEHHKRRLRLWVQEDAASARALYESFGFSYTGTKKPFPRQPSRQLLEMDLTLRSATA